MVTLMIDIRDYADVIESVNAVVNNCGIAEIKLEGGDKKQRVVVVEIKRTLKASAAK